MKGRVLFFIVGLCIFFVLSVGSVSAVPPDDNGDGCLSIGEISGYVASWLQGQITIQQVASGVSWWLGGCTAAHDRSLLFSQAYDLTWPPPMQNDGLYGAEVNPTGNPLGGFYGYDRIVSPSDADFIVHDKDEFLSALQQVQSGQIIYIDDNSVIDLTGIWEVHIPGNITIASGRGSDFSQGGLIRNLQQPYRWPGSGSLSGQFLVTDGPNIRITGLRLQGQDGTIQDSRQYAIDYINPPRPDLASAYYDMVTTHGIYAQYPYLEVDNCEIYDWTSGGIYLTRGYYPGSTNSSSYNNWIHHNYIHNNVHGGLGYGVTHGYSDYDHPINSLIEANIFDRNRHSIATTYTQYSSYEARYNLVGSRGTQQQFDRHGNDGWSGDYTIIDHNTCTAYTYNGGCVGISGIYGSHIPDGIRIYNNWAYAPIDNTIRVTNITQGIISNNWAGIYTMPPGVQWPVAVLSMDTDSVRAGSSITFSGSGSHENFGQISYVCFDFGDSTGQSCTLPDGLVSHTFPEPGRYLITLKAMDPKGVFSTATDSVIVYPADPHAVVLSFWQRDSYNQFNTNDSPGYFMKQVLVDNVTVWERDPYDDGTAWEHVVLDITPYVHDVSELKLQVKSLQTYSGPLYPGNHAFDIYNQYFDDIYVFNRDYSAENFGDWEDNSLTSAHTKGVDGTVREGEGAWYMYFNGDPWWEGTATLEDAQSGIRSFMLDAGYRLNSTAGSTRGIKQTIRAPDDKNYLYLADDFGTMRDKSSYQVPAVFAGSKDAGDNEMLDFFGYSKKMNGIDNYVYVPSFDLSRDYAFVMDAFLPYRNMNQTLMYASNEAGFVHIYYSPPDMVVIRGNGFESSCSLPGFSHARFVSIVIGRSCTGAVCTLSCASNGIVNPFSSQNIDLTLAGSSSVGFGGFAGSASDMFGAIHEVRIMKGSMPASAFLNESKSMLQGAWYFRDGTAGTVMDASGNNYDISLPALASFGSEDGRGFLIENQASSPLIRIPRNSSSVIGDQFSVELVARFDDLSTNHFTVIDGSPYSLVNRRYLSPGYPDGRRIHLAIKQTDVSTNYGEGPFYGTYGARPVHELKDNIWYDIVYTKYDDYLRTYVNGVLDDKVYVPGISYDNSVVSNLTITNEFSGDIERFAVWDKVLSTADAEALYQSSSLGCSDSDDDGYGVFPRSGVVNGCRLDGFDCNDDDAGVGSGGC